LIQDVSAHDSFGARHRLAADFFNSIDPIETLAGPKSRSAAVTCHI
jgi:hypothetical protein